MIEADIDMSGFLKGTVVFDHELQRRMQAEVDALAQQGANVARGRAAFRTGFMLHSIGVSSRMGPLPDGEVRSQFKAGAGYSSFVERGTRPHTISARKAKTLRFRGRGGGWVSVKSVRHPGTQAQPFMGPAEQMVTAALPAALERSIDAASRAAFGD